MSVDRTTRSAAGDGSRTARTALGAAVLALVLGLSGTAYAAGLAKNSVGTAQLKKNAVTAAKLKPGAVTGAKVKDGSLGGADVRNGSITTADLAPGTVPTAPLVGDLPSGKTLQGYAATLEQPAAADVLASVSVSFANPLPADLPNEVTDVIDVGDPVPAGCSGTASDPGADPGHLCVFIIEKNRVGLVNINGPDGDGTASRFGFNFWVRSNAAGVGYARASWAVTAP